MTDLLYQTDSYLREFDAVVVDVDEAGSRVALDRTAFYPSGGGQPCDLGVLRLPVLSGTETPEVSLAVTQVKKRAASCGTRSRACCRAKARLSGELDWARRYQLMQTHSALHVLCGVVYRDYGALVTGGNMDPGQGRMDFEFATMHGDLVSEIEARCNEEIAARDIRVKILPRAEAFQIPDLIRTKINLLPEGIAEVRTVEIVGLDLQADGGTHVANTREIGRIRVTDYKSKGAINKRIYIEVG